MAGRRAFCSIPSGVEEEVIIAEAWESEFDRKEGIRGIFECSLGDLGGEVSDSEERSDSGRVGVAKSFDSTEESAARVAGVAIVKFMYSCLAAWNNEGSRVSRACPVSLW